MKAHTLLLPLIFAFATVCLAQAPAESSPEKAAVVANDRAFEAAYAKADVKALLEFFTEDAEYTADDGRTFTGRAAIEQTLRSAFLTNKGAKLSITPESVRLIAPQILVEKGSTTVTGNSGESSGALYTAIHVMKDGKWKIHNLVESPAPVVSARERLAELGWLIGKWEESDPANNLSVSSQYTAARGGNFITRNVVVKQANEVSMEGWQIIGWDPLEDRLRTWTFDDQGGFSEGYFTREGERWLLRETGVSADGTRTSADNTFTKLGPDRFTWESNNRTLDGDPQPAIGRIEIRRVKGD